ncbi:MAG: GGDEF domain-containing phosphodiesterase [Gammaproteobacteria bacterium]
MPDGNTPRRYSSVLREIEALRSESGVTNIALLLVSLHGLAEVNRALGYLAGDRVLEAVTDRVAGIGRAQDRLVPIDGSLFAILVRNPLHEGHAVLGAEKALRVVAEPVEFAGQRGVERARLRARVGIALWPGTATSAEELLRQCEWAIDEARRRDESWMVYRDVAAAADAPKPAAWFEIDDALRQGEFEIHYQPKIDLRTGVLCGAEALARWRHPVRGLLPPGYFMPVIEGTESVRTLLWYALNTSLRQAAEWVRRWPDFRVAVNASPTNLADADLVELLSEALHIWNLPAGHLVLEITESALMHDPAQSVRRLQGLRELGIHISIDDFGTGYSSLAYLKNLPADELKIDRSFISGITANDTDRRLAESVVQLGHAVGLEVVAEGIEDDATRQALVAMGCDIGQGYHLGRPASGADFESQWSSPATDPPTTRAAPESGPCEERRESAG